MDGLREAVVVALHDVVDQTLDRLALLPQLRAWHGAMLSKRQLIRATLC